MLRNSRRFNERILEIIYELILKYLSQGRNRWILGSDSDERCRSSSLKNCKNQNLFSSEEEKALWISAVSLIFTFTQLQISSYSSVSLSNYPSLINSEIEKIHSFVFFSKPPKKKKKRNISIEPRQLQQLSLNSPSTRKTITIFSTIIRKT